MSPKTAVVDRKDSDNHVIVRVPAWRVIVVRASITFLTVFLSLTSTIAAVPAALPAEMTGIIFAPFITQAAVAAQLALIASVFDVLRNTLSILTRLDEKNPQVWG